MPENAPFQRFDPQCARAFSPSSSSMRAGHISVHVPSNDGVARACMSAQAIHGAQSVNILAADHTWRVTHSALRRFTMGFKEALRC